MKGRLAFYIIFLVVTPIYFLIAEEYHYALTSKMQKTPLLTTGQAMKSKDLILGFILGTGSSSNPKIEHSAGIFGSVGVVSDLIGIRGVYSTEGTLGELLLYPVKTKAVNITLGIGGKYYRDTISPVYSLYISYLFDDMVPYAALRYDKTYFEIPLEYDYQTFSEEDIMFKSSESLMLALGLDYTGIENVGLIFEVNYIPVIDAFINYNVYYWGSDTSYNYYEITEETSKNIMQIGISGYLKF